VILRLAVLLQYRRVTDGQTNRRMNGHMTTSISARQKSLTGTRHAASRFYYTEVTAHALQASKFVRIWW